jgi:hypothetical protein
MANPDYASILAQIAAATDPAVIASLKAQLVINEELTQAEKELFEYTVADYMEFNPGYNNDFKAYVGVYYNDDGDST